MKVEKNISVNIKQQIKVTTLNLTDIIANSNKFYNLEILETDNNKFVIYTNYGRTGSSVAKEYRFCSSLSEAEKESDKIIKSKLKKGYIEIKLIKTDVGSEIGKQKINNSVDVKEIEQVFGKDILIQQESKLSTKVQHLVKSWFNATSAFIEVNLDTKKCPLGQLSLQQIIKGRDILNEARLIVHNSKSISELNKLTNLYYSNIPHALSRSISPETLRLDSDDKITNALDMLDVFSNAKDLGNKIQSNSIDQKYETLNSTIEDLDNLSETYKWIEKFFHETRAPNHGSLGKLKVHNIFKVKRNNEEENFLRNAERIAKECGKFSPAKLHGKMLDKRPDIDGDLDKLYKNSNTLLMCHGSKLQNISSIVRLGLLIRPTGICHQGSLFGDAIYAGFSSKAINYCNVAGSIYSNDSNKTGYLFILDCTLGKQKIADWQYMHTKENIKPFHSVYAIGGKSGVINDEMMLYEQTGENQQHYIKYVVEFETQVK